MQRQPHREYAMKRIILSGIVLTLILILFSIAGCSKNEAPSQKATRVSATNAYEKYFGPAPTSNAGTCFAFVIYFPSAKSPGKVVPFPFFTFDEGSIKNVAVERLLSGMNLPAYRGEFLQPFHAGTRLLDLTEDNGAVTLNFSNDFISIKGDRADEQGVLNALALTLSQFKGIKEVRISVAGKDGVSLLSSGEMIHNPLVVDVRAVLEPGPPRLLEIAGLKDKGAKTIEDVQIYFDRPVDIKDLNLTDTKGKPFAGKTFHSVFDMAAVFKPKDTSQFTSDMSIKVSWKVVDKLVRSGEGETVLPLEIKVH